MLKSAANDDEREAVSVLVFSQSHRAISASYKCLNLALCILHTVRLVLEGLINTVFEGVYILRCKSLQRVVVGGYIMARFFVFYHKAFFTNLLSL